MAPYSLFCVVRGRESLKVACWFEKQSMPELFAVKSVHVSDEVRSRPAKFSTLNIAVVPIILQEPH